MTGSIPIKLRDRLERLDPTGRTLVSGVAAAFGVIVITAIVSQFREDRPVVAFDDELECLALNVYWEARSEDERGQKAIAHLTLNRVDSPDFPDSVCAVVKQGRGGRHRCQFSWYCDGLHDRPANPDAWETAVEVAKTAHRARVNDPTKGALYFHLRRVKPKWARSMTRTVEIGDHFFYK